MLQLAQTLEKLSRSFFTKRSAGSSFKTRDCRLKVETILYCDSGHKTYEQQSTCSIYRKTDGISKPWMLVLLRLKKLEERRNDIPSDQYLAELEDIHQDMMNLGEWWVGIEDEVFDAQAQEDTSGYGYGR